MSNNNTNLLHHQILKTIHDFISTNDSSSSSSELKFLTNVICGKRGSGKTHLLDQIHCSMHSYHQYQQIENKDDHDENQQQEDEKYFKSLCQLKTVISPTQTIYHFHSSGIPSQVSKMTLDVELFVTKILQEDENQERHSILLVTIDDFDLLLQLNNLQQQASGGDDDGTTTTKSGAGRFQQQQKSNSNHDDDDHKKLLWGWFYEEYKKKYRASFEGEKNGKNIDVILLVSTSAGSAESLTQNDTKNWIFPDSLNWSIPSCDSKEIPSVFQNLSLPQEILRKPTITDLNLMMMMSRSETNSNVNEVAALITLLKKSDKANSALTENTEIARRLLKMKVDAKHNTTTTTATTAKTTSRNKLDCSAIAKRTGCFSAFSRLTETIDRFAAFSRGNVSTSSSATKPKTGKVAAALQPPTGILVIDSELRSDGRAQFLLDLVAKHVQIESEKNHEENSSSTLSIHKVDAPLLFGPIFGETEENIRAAFQDAYAKRPCVLMIQNVDAIALSRGALQQQQSSNSNNTSDSVNSNNNNNSSGNVLQRAVATFLIEADGVDRPDRAASVLIVASTSNKQDMDSAALRPGRLEMHVQLSDCYDKLSTASSSSSSYISSAVDIVPSELANLAIDSPEDLIDGWFQFCEPEENENENENKSKIAVIKKSSSLRKDLVEFFQEVFVEDALRIIHCLKTKQKQNRNLLLLSEQIVRDHVFGGK